MYESIDFRVPLYSIPHELHEDQLPREVVEERLRVDRHCRHRAACWGSWPS